MACLSRVLSVRKQNKSGVLKIYDLTKKCGGLLEKVYGVCFVSNQNKDTNRKEHK